MRDIRADSPRALHDRLVQLLPAQFDTLVFKLAVPPSYLSAPTAPLATRAVELVRYAEAQGSGGIDRLVAVLDEVRGVGLRGDARGSARAPTRRVPTRASLRRLLHQVLRSDADLDAFCIDHFPGVHQRTTNGMDRTQKVNLLFTHADAGDILERLGKVDPAGVAAHEGLVEYEA